MKFVQAKILNDLPRHMQGRLIEVIKTACQRQVLARPCWYWLLAPIPSERGSCMTLYNMWIHVQSKMIGKRRCFAWEKLAKSPKWPYGMGDETSLTISSKFGDYETVVLPTDLLDDTTPEIFWKTIVSNSTYPACIERKSTQNSTKKKPGHIGRRFMVC